MVIQAMIEHGQDARGTPREVIIRTVASTGTLQLPAKQQGPPLTVAGPWPIFTAFPFAPHTWREPVLGVQSMSQGGDCQTGEFGNAGRGTRELGTRELGARGSELRIEN